MMDLLGRKLGHKQQGLQVTKLLYSLVVISGLAVRPIWSQSATLTLESFPPGTLPTVSKTIDVSDIADQSEISRRAGLFAISPEGWDLGRFGASLDCQYWCPPAWTAVVHGVCIHRLNEQVGQLLGYGLNEEALTYDPDFYYLWFHTDEWAVRLEHEIGESPNNYGVISAGMGGLYFQCPYPNFGRFSIQSVTPDVTSGLIGYWSFDEGSGDTAYDYSGNGNNGTVCGYATWVHGVAGKALNFDGVDDYLEVADDPILNPTDALSVAAWIRIDSFNNDLTCPEPRGIGGIVCKYCYPGICPSRGLGYILRIGNGGINSNWDPVPIENNKINFVIHPDGVASHRVDVYSEAIELDQWYHVVGTYNGTELKLYVNGSLADSVPAFGQIITSDSPLNIGRDYYQNTRAFNGVIDEVRIYNMALSSAQIQILYERQANHSTAFYFNDFESPVGSEWSNTATDVTPVGNRRFLGQLSNDTVNLTLNGLPSHEYVTVSLDLFIIRSWDGSDLTYGPDTWDISVDGTSSLLHTTFCNFRNTHPGFGQSYPGSYPGSSYLPQTGSVETDSLGYHFVAYGEDAGDSVYHLSFTFPHSDNSIQFNFAGSGLQELEDESWGIDNVSIRLSNGPTGESPNEEYHNGYQDNRSGSTSDPVHTATGNFFHSETDLSIATRAMPLVFSRHYNSKDSRSGPLGPGWTHSYYVYLIDNVNLVSVCWGDGRTDYWNPDGLGGYEPNTVGLYDSLKKDGSNWILTRKNLDNYVFNADGLLTSISDKNGNALTLSYSDAAHPNRVTSVSDAAGRSIALSYYADGLLARVADFAVFPRTVEFSYTGGYLTQVKDVDDKLIRYGYDPSGYLATIIDQRGVTTVTNTYDDQGRVIEQLDGNGNRTTFAYDTPGLNQTTITDANDKLTIHTHISGYKLLYSIQNPLGHTVYYNYDEQGNRRAVTDRNGNTTYFVYDNRGNVVETTAADGGTTIVDYNEPNFPDLPTRKIDALGNITGWEYDNRGNVILQIDPNGYERTWTYNSFGQKLSETDENENPTTYIYDTNGLLTEIVDAEGNHIWYDYDQLWRLTHITDGRGSFAGDTTHTTVTEYDKADRVISVTGPITTESYGYDEVGNRTRVTNGRGYSTTYHYDNNNNLIRIERPAPAAQTQVIQYGYDRLDRKIATTDPNGNVTINEYDDAGRLIREINDENDVTAYTYDPHGNVLSITDGNGVTISYGYDPMNRKVHQYDELGNHWYWEYNKLGQLTKHTDAMGYKTQYGYDVLGRLTSVIDDVNNPTRYSYDRIGNVREIQDAAGKVIEKRFCDSANRLIKKEDGLGNAYEYTFDGAGNVISEKNPNGHTKTFVYDNQNRLIEIHYPDSSHVAYGYDKNGNLEEMTDHTGTTIYTYDELDRLTSSTDSFGKKVQYGYDIIGNRTSITYPADPTNPARTVSYTYDKANRLDKVIDWDGRIWVYTVDGAGRITDVNYPNGIKEQRTYDEAGRFSSLIYRDSSDANLITYSYTRDGQGNPIEISETGTLEPVLDLPLKEDYAYDSDNRLTETTTPATYGYDNNGNMTSRVSAGVTTIFAYDFENRLISQTTGASTVRHIYDGRGNRIVRNDNSQVTRYVLDRGRSMSHVLCETDAFGQIVAYYIHGPQILARIDADGSERYYHTDPMGSVVALTDESEAFTDRYAYTPFGVPAGHEGSSPNPFTYVGGLGVMADTDGLYFMRARFYEPTIGIFLSKDPVGSNLINESNVSFYSYARSSPLRYFDPQGLCPRTSYTNYGTLEVMGNVQRKQLDAGCDNMPSIWIPSFSMQELASQDLPMASLYRTYEPEIMRRREEKRNIEKQNKELASLRRLEIFRELRKQKYIDPSLGTQHPEVMREYFRRYEPAKLEEYERFLFDMKKGDLIKKNSDAMAAVGGAAIPTDVQVRPNGVVELVPIGTE